MGQTLTPKADKDSVGPCGLHRLLLIAKSWLPESGRKEAGLCSSPQPPGLCVCVCMCVCLRVCECVCSMKA